MLLLHGTMLAAPLALSFAHTRHHVNAVGICVFKMVCGVDCPACGITHSVMAMLDGRMGEAFRFHPAGPIVVGIITIMTLYLTLVLLTGYRGIEWGKEARAYNGLETVGIVALMIGWVGKAFIN
jgi:hypothetical protein